jgi:tetratricopeptide (TPR) repeat protein/NAD-dependent SIR2 family protein deacetylase
MNEIAEKLLGGELALFCGAGISKNSGLPLALELRRYILRTLLMSKKHVDQAMKVRYPFEAFMQSLFDHVGSQDMHPERILDLFRQSNPNSNHVLIARLAKQGYLKTVVTTNFDLLIERALEQEGLREGADFDRFHREEHFSPLLLDGLSKRFTLFKLHGSIHDVESIRTTLAKVASKELSEKRMEVIKHLFSTGKHEAVLVLGYSCSDTFDLIPQIQSIHTDKKQVFFVEHSASTTTPVVSELNRRKKKNPFSHFPGQWITCNTELLIKDLWMALAESVGNYQPIRCDFDWRREVDKWLGSAKTNLGLKRFMCGFVLWESQRASKPGDVQLFNLARFYYERALEFATGAQDLKAMAACNYEMGRVYLTTRTNTKKASAANFKKAVERYKEGLRIATSDDLSDEFLAATCCHALGTCYTDLRRLLKITARDNLSDKSLAATCCSALGISYTDLLEFKTAKDYLKESRRRYRLLQDPQQIDAGLAGSYLQLGNMHLVEKNPTEALACFKKSFSLAPLIPQYYNNAGIAYQMLKRCGQAIRCCEMCEKTSEERGDMHSLNAAYARLSDVYKACGDTTRSEHYKNMLQLNQARMRDF